MLVEVTFPAPTTLPVPAQTQGKAVVAAAGEPGHEVLLHRRQAALC